MNRFITILLLVLSAATASAQKAADWRDLLTIVDDNNRTVYYERESHKPLKGEYRIKRGLDIEFVKLKDGVIDGDYRRYRNGELRESGKYVKGKREGEEWETSDSGNGTQSRIVRHYADGVLNGKYRTELTRDGKLIYLIEGEYLGGEKTGQWIEHNYEAVTASTSWLGEGGA